MMESLLLILDMLLLIHTWKDDKLQKVSTVGIRNQVTLPKDIRKQLQQKDKFSAFISVDKKMLRITLSKPEGLHNSIAVSDKGQFVVPKNLRESLDISENDNLVFNVVKDYVEIRKLAASDTFTTNVKFDFVCRVIDAAGGSLWADDGSLILKNKPSGQLIISLQDLFGVGFMFIEQKEYNKRPAWYLKPFQ